MAYNRYASTNQSWLFKNLNREQVEFVIRRSDLNQACTTDCISLKNFKTVGSYNWSPESTKTKPIIVIPGKSNQLVHDLMPKQLIKSSREQMVDENRFNLPDFPLEPLFRSVQECTPDFKFSEIDFVSDRNGLRKLLDFVDNVNKDSFRIDFQKMGNMINFIRNDELASQITEDYGTLRKRIPHYFLMKYIHLNLTKAKISSENTHLAIKALTERLSHMNSAHSSSCCDLRLTVLKVKKIIQLIIYSNPWLAFLSDKKMLKTQLNSTIQISHL